MGYTPQNYNAPNNIPFGANYSTSFLGSPKAINVAQNQNAGTTPAWLQPNFGEAQSTYQNIGNSVEGAIAPLRSAYQQTINQNTGMGMQAANSAAREYANRAALSGGSALGAGVVRAQSMLPIFQQNATARQQEANTEAGYKMQGLGIQAQLASSLGQLRNSYAGTLANYMTQQRSQDIGMAQGNQQAAISVRNQGVAAANALLSSKSPMASYTTNALTGQITNGQDSYNSYLQDQRQRDQARAYLAQVAR